MRTVEEILQDAERRGWKLGNLFQRNERVWWAEFRPGSPLYKYRSATGATPAKALEAALASVSLVQPISIDELF